MSVKERPRSSWEKKGVRRSQAGLSLGTGFTGDRILQVPEGVSPENCRPTTGFE